MKECTSVGQMVMTATLTTKQEKKEELFQTLGSLFEGIRTQPGCRECMASQDVVGEPRFHIQIGWKDSLALETFLATDVFRILMGAMNVLAEPAEFHLVGTEDTCSLTEWNRRRAAFKPPSPQAPSP